MSRTGLSELKKLSSIISAAVDRIEQTLDHSKLDFPSLTSPYKKEEEAVRAIPDVANATLAIVAAAEQLAMVARPPSSTLLDISFKVHSPIAY